MRDEVAIWDQRVTTAESLVGLIIADGAESFELEVPALDLPLIVLL